MTLEITPAADPATHERIEEGLVALFAQRNVARVIKSHILGPCSLFVLLSTDDAATRSIIDEILNNEQLPASTVTLARGIEVPTVIRGETNVDAPIHDSIIGSFLHVETVTVLRVRNCLHCKHFKMLPLGEGADLQISCDKGMNNAEFKKRLQFTARPHNSVLMLREVIELAVQCDEFQHD